MKYISIRTWEVEKQAKENWHIWFAWYPVTVKQYPDGAKKKIWLENVYRKGYYSCDWGECSWAWDYKEIPERKEVGMQPSQPWPIE